MIAMDSTRYSRSRHSPVQPCSLTVSLRLLSSIVYPTSCPRMRSGGGGGVDSMLSFGNACLVGCTFFFSFLGSPQIHHSGRRTPDHPSGTPGALFQSGTCLSLVSDVCVFPLCPAWSCLLAVLFNLCSFTLLYFCVLCVYVLAWFVSG